MTSQPRTEFGDFTHRNAEPFRSIAHQTGLPIGEVAEIFEQRAWDQRPPRKGHALDGAVCRPRGPRAFEGV
jgi:hypothetical protein